jgi:hypothetical protein
MVHLHTTVKHDCINEKNIMELKKMLILLSNIIDADRTINTEIHNQAPSFTKLIPIAYDCLNELGW